ncbi:MAG: hypothetical protein ACUVRK_08350 [Spirochaetota bacterium]
MIKKLLLILSVIAYPITTFALFDNYNNYQYLIGDRAAGFGGAYCAIANDSTALWYNPAGLAQITDNKINISANSYNYLTRNSKQYWHIEKSAGSYETLDLKEQDVSVVPTSVAYARKGNILGNDALAFGIFVPIQDNVVGNIIGKAPGSSMTVDLNASYRMNSKAYYGVGGYGLQLSPDISIGVSAGFGYLQDKGGANIAAYLDPGNPNQSQISMIINSELTAYTLFSGAGIHYSPVAHHHCGVFLHSPTYRIHAQFKETQTTQQVGPILPDGNKSETTITKNDYETIVMPAYISFVYGYVKENAWAWSIEGTVHFTNDELPNKVINGRTGIELYIFNNMIARAGVFTDFCQKDKVTQTSKNDEHNDYYGATISLSFGNELNPLANESVKAKNMWTTIGVAYQIGIGHIRRFRIYTTSSSEIMPINKQYTHRYSIYIGESIAL